MEHIDSHSQRADVELDFSLRYESGFSPVVRISEWAQEDAFKHLSSGGKLSPIPQLHGHLAFTLEDVQCFNRRGTPISLHTFLRDRKSVSKIVLTFSWQKNKNHGEKRTFLVNLSTPLRSPLSV